MNTQRVTRLDANFPYNIKPPTPIKAAAAQIIPSTAFRLNPTTTFPTPLVPATIALEATEAAALRSDEASTAFVLVAEDAAATSELTSVTAPVAVESSPEGDLDAALLALLAPVLVALAMDAASRQ